MGDYEYRVVDKRGEDVAGSFPERDEAYEWIVESILSYNEPTDEFHVERRPKGRWERDDITVSV